MDLRTSTTTPALRSATTPAMATRLAPDEVLDPMSFTEGAEAASLAPLAERYVGDLVGTSPKERRQPIFAGARLGAPEGYTNAAEAATALAQATDGTHTPAAVLVQRDGGRVDAFVLETPVWKKTWFRTEVVGSTPAHVDADHGGASLADDVVRTRGDGGELAGRIQTGTYGTPIGTVVGIVDDTWGRLNDGVVDLGAPFDVQPARPVTEPMPDGKAALSESLGARADRLSNAADSIGALRRDAHPDDVRAGWTDLRTSLATIDTFSGYPKLPKGFRETLAAAKATAVQADGRLGAPGRLSDESPSWAREVAPTLEASAQDVRRLASDPWITDLDTGDVAKLLTTALGAADSRIGRSIGQLLAVPKGAEADDRYLPLRKEARALNLAAQEQLETLFNAKGLPKGVLSALRSADASLEDATWQIVGKPSPDGRFSGLDLAGAIDSERTARERLRDLAKDYDVDLGDATEPTPEVPEPAPAPAPAPTPSPSPTPGVDPVVARDVRRALEFLAKSEGSLASIPLDAQEAETWLPTRKSARQDNLDAQKLLEDRFLAAGTPQSVVSTLRRADATLEDVTWQIVGKPSPDGRFNGVDIPGAIRDTQAAIDLLEGLVGA